MIVLDEDRGQIALTREALGGIIAEMMRPVMQTIGKMLENNTAALEQLSASQSVQNDRLEALEKQIRLQTPVSAKQASYLNDAIRRRGRELLDKRGIEDAKAVTKLGGRIRKAVLSRYGIGSLREIPRHEYPVAMQQIEIWNDALAVRDAVKEARSRAGDDAASGQPRPAPHPDGGAKGGSEADQPGIRPLPGNPGEADERAQNHT